VRAGGESPAGHGSAAPRARAAAPRPPDAGGDWRRFYGQPEVRRRIEEFLGGPPLAAATAIFVTRPSPWRVGAYHCLPVSDTWALLEADPELSRALWDREDLIVDIDLEHVNFDRPAEPVRSPGRARELLAPTLSELRRRLDRAGVQRLEILTGRGRHLLWRVARGSRSFAALARLGRLDPDLADLYDEPQPPTGERVGEELGRAWDGLGRILEWLGQRVVASAARATPIPIKLTAVEVGGEPGRREIVSLDLSAFGDPIHRRSVRIPFTAYLKSWPPEPEPDPRSAAIRVAVPAVGDAALAASAAGDLRIAATLASETSCAIPDGSSGTLRLIDAYRRSALARFHRRFDADVPHSPERWPETYDRTELGGLPACAARILAEPNDLLLRPAAIQLVVRTLVALGWRPRHVAGLVRSKYERPHGWRHDLHFHHAGVRAEFYTRLFAGQIATGLDQQIDFNCTSTREKGLCTERGCPWNLAELGSRLGKGGARA
jgi:hypothetical protein